MPFVWRCVALRQRLCARTNSQPTPSQRLQLPVGVNPVAEHAVHSFQSVFRISRTFVPAHRSPPTSLPHSPSTSAASYDSAPQFVQLATGFGLLFIRSPFDRVNTRGGPALTRAKNLLRFPDTLTVSRLSRWRYLVP